MVNHAVVFAMRRGGVLLARHLEGRHFGARLPPSGKVKPSDEGTHTTAAREADEEMGITLVNPRCLGIVEILKGRDEKNLRLFVYAATYRGKPRESNEMDDPQFFPIQELPLKDMWSDAPRWVPRLLNQAPGDPPLGLRLRLVRGPDSSWFHVVRFNPDDLIRKHRA
jgi:8-oxo-dGTP diphosphatase